jgi:hypothetical protein
VSICRHLRIFRSAMTVGVVALALGACSSSQHSAGPVVTSAPATSAPSATISTAPATATISTTAATPKQALPPLNFQTLPVPSHYTCPAGLYFLSPANQAVGECVPYAYLVGGTASDPDNHTACPAGSFMTMGPVECDNDTGIVTPVPPGQNTCSTPGGPCPSAKLPLSPQASVLPWSARRFPAGKCPAGYYFGETNGVATCVPYAYLPGGTPAHPDDNTACPAGSGLKAAQLTGTLCTQDAQPYDIVAPVPATSSAAANLPEGLYVDARDGLPHYILSLGPSGRDGIKGSVNFLYQDGRVSFTGEYKGLASGGGKLTIRFYTGTISHGKIVLHGRGTVLTGTYRQRNLHLDDCTSVLPWAAEKQLGCTFSFHGYTP